MTPQALAAACVIGFTGQTTMAHADTPPVNAAIELAVANGQFAGVHAVLVTLQGETLAQVYFPGEDEVWGRSAGMRDHGPDTLHDVRSISKSIVGLLYGIALHDGLVPPPDAALLDHLPDYADLATDPQRRAITVGHTLSMRMGTEWNEDLPYSDTRNSEVAMEMAQDRYRYALDRPMLSTPGTQWTYNGGATALIGKLIEDGTGMPLADYAQKALFAPLGITDFAWSAGADGVAAAASGLRLTAPDLARIGSMILADGMYDGQQVVPKDWLTAAFTPQADLEQLRYGYLWWLSGQGTPPDWVAGFGNGGQRLTVQPAIGLVMVVFAGRYNDPDAWQIPVGLIEEIIAPEIRARLQK